MPMKYVGGDINALRNSVRDRILLPISGIALFYERTVPQNVMLLLEYKFVGSGLVRSPECTSKSDLFCKLFHSIRPWPILQHPNPNPNPYIITHGGRCTFVK